MGNITHEIRNLATAEKENDQHDDDKDLPDAQSHMKYSQQAAKKGRKPNEFKRTLVSQMVCSAATCKVACQR
ncbi:hypothetical protein NBRC116588_24160 [Pyruvatibacter sp. HU-CL02332]